MDDDRWHDPNLNERYVSGPERWPYQAEGTGLPHPDKLRLFTICISCHSEIGIPIMWLMRGDGAVRCPCGSVIVLTNDRLPSLRDLWRACKQNTAREWLERHPQAYRYNGYWKP